MGSTNRTPCRSSRTGFVVGSLLLEFGLFSAAKASTIALTPTSSVISSGAPFTIDLNISGLSSNQALSGFDVSVSFDGSKLAYQSATFGDPRSRRPTRYIPFRDKRAERYRWHRNR